MLIKAYSIKAIDDYFFDTYRNIILILAAASVIFILAKWNGEIAIPTLAIFITPCIFISWRRFRDNVFSIALIFWLMVYVYIPLAYISILAENYEFGSGLLSLPYSQAEYFDAYIPNLYFLFACIFSAFLGLCIVPTKFRLFTSHVSLSSFGSGPIMLLGIISVGIYTNDILISLAARAANEAGNEGLIKFLFFNHAYLFLAGVALFGINHSDPKVQAAQAKSILWIAALFTAVGMLAGSKASWLGILYFFFLTSYSYIRNKPDGFVLLPSKSVAVGVIIMAPLLYFLTFFYRLTMTTSLEFDISMILSLLDALDFVTLGVLADQIFYRLAAGGVDRFMLISTTFLSAENLAYGIQEYLPYMMKNTANLLLPGTVYPEAYAPSSQLYPQVISMAPMDGDLSAAYLVRKINSQAYTLFGVMAIFGGWFAPFLVFLYNVILCISYCLFKNLFIRMTLIYFYFGAISSFGFEIAVGYAYHVLICFFFMYFLLLGFSKIKISYRSGKSSWFPAAKSL